MFGFLKKLSKKKQLSEEDRIAIALREKEICGNNHDWTTYKQTPYNSQLGIEVQVKQVCRKCDKKRIVHY